MRDCNCYDEMYNYLFAAALVTGLSLFTNVGQCIYFRLYVRENGDPRVVHSHEVEEKDNHM